MNQYIISVLYSFIYTAILAIGLSWIFVKKKNFSVRKLCIILFIFLVIDLVILTLNKTRLEKQQVHFDTLSQILTLIVIISTLLFLNFMIH